MVENQFNKDAFGGIQITDMAILPETETDFEIVLAKWIEQWS